MPRHRHGFGHGHGRSSVTILALSRLVLIIVAATRIRHALRFAKTNTREIWLLSVVNIIVENRHREGHRRLRRAILLLRHTTARIRFTYWLHVVSENWNTRHVMVG